MDNDVAQLLYAYLVGCSEAQRDDRRMKCFSFKELSKNVQNIVAGQEGGGEGAEEQKSEP